MKIVTWNVNSVKARLQHLRDYLKSAQPDVLLLQEIKCTDADFPRLEVESAGYHALIVGQKSYNGVAILSKTKPTDAIAALPGSNGDEHARYIEATVGDMRIASIYLPNGNPIGTDKFTYKLAWMERLIAHARDLMRQEVPFVLGGDYNVCPTDADVFSPKVMRDDALCQPESRAAFRRLLFLGLTDAITAFGPVSKTYTFWDYQAGRWNRDEGLRIDHLLLSPVAADRFVGAGIDKAERAKERASDHTPVWCEIV
jgi:exodeoxyribonuclease III